MIAHSSYFNWRAAFSMPADVEIYDWAENNIVIPSNYPGPFSGPYRQSLTPYMAGIYQAMRDPRIRTVTVMKGGQTGFTLAVQIYLMYQVVEDPSSMMMFLPTTTLARSISETRLQVLMQHNPMVRAEIHPDPNRFKNLEYMLNRCTVKISGANNATQTSSTPARVVIIDETDKIPKKGKEEASPIKLAIERSKAFWNRKIIEGSTPTTKAGYIYRSYMLGDQRKLFCPCHACGHEQVLSWQVVKFDEGGRNARYTCEACRADWDRMQTLRAIDLAQWRATAEPADPTHASFHLPSFYSRWVDVRDLAIEFIESKDEPHELQKMINSTFAEPFEIAPNKSAQGKTIWTFRDMHKYARGRVPFAGKCFLALCVDIQNTYLPWAVWAIGPKDQSLVDHGNASVPDDILEIADRVYRQGETSVPIRMAVIDTGHRTMEAYDLCRVLGRKVMVIPVKGSTGISQAEPIRTQRIGTYPDGKPLPANESIILRHVHPRFFHDDAWAMLEPLESKDGMTLMEAWDRRKVRIHFHEEIDRDFVNQITAEVLRESDPDRRGRTKLEVHVIRKNNHQFDNFRYSLVARYLLEEDLKDAEKKPLSEKKPMPTVTLAGGIPLENISL